MFWGLVSALPTNQSWADLPTKPNTTAVCFPGDARGFAVTYKHQQIFLERIGAGTELNYFYVIQFARYENAFPTSATWNAIKAMKPTKMKILDLDNHVEPFPNSVYNESFQCQDQLDPEFRTQGGGEMFGSFYYQNSYLKDCLQLVKEQEMEQGWKYQFAMRSRFDILMYGFDNVNIFDSLDGYIHMHILASFALPYIPQDPFAFMLRDAAEAHFTAIDLMTSENCWNWADIELSCAGWSRDGKFPECMLAAWIHHKGYDYVFDEGDFRLCRDVGAPDCPPV